MLKAAPTRRVLGPSGRTRVAPLVRGSRALRAGTWLLVGTLLAATLPSCGGGQGLDVLGLGTVAVRNDSDLGSNPVTVTSFFLAPTGSVDPGPNRLVVPVPPGGVVIIGLFPEGNYDAVAVLSVGAQINFPTTLVRSEQPTDFVIPGN